MLTCVGRLNLESFAILDGQDRHVVLAPDLPTWDDNQSPQYRKSTRLPHRLLRIPDTDLSVGELQAGRGLPQINIDFKDSTPFIVLPGDSKASIRSATWRLHWPIVSRGTCACVGIAIHPNTPDSPVDRLLYWDLAPESPSCSSTLDRTHGLPTPDFVMTLTVHWTSRRLLEVSLNFYFIDLPPSAARTLRREVWLGLTDAPSLTLTPFISTSWGCAQVDMHFVGFLRLGVLELKTLCRFRILQRLINVIQSDKNYVENCVWMEADRLAKRLPVSKNVRSQLRLFENHCKTS